MSEIKTMKEERAEVLNQMEELDEQLRECDDADKREELKSEFDAYENEFEQMGDEISRAERMAERRAKFSEPSDDLGERSTPSSADEGEITDEDRALAFQGWTRRKVGEDVTGRQREAAEKIGQRLDAPMYDLRLISDYDRIERAHRKARSEGKPFECRVMGVNESETPAEGKELVPEGFSNRLEDALLSYGNFRQAASVMRTDTGNDIPYPTSNDTGNQGEYVAEASDVSGTATDVPISSITLEAHKVSSKMVKLSSELLTDSAFNMAQFVGGKIGERIGRISNAKFTTGSGTNVPYGIVTELAAGSSGSEYITSDSSTSITPGDIDDLVHSVDPAYRNMGCSFMMNDAVYKTLKSEQEDSKTIKLWAGNQWTHTENGVPYLGPYPVIINQDMSSSVTSGDNTILFGQLSKYMIREVNTMRIRVLEERYAENDEVAYIAFMRNDGHLLDAGTHPVVLLQQS